MFDIITDSDFRKKIKFGIDDKTPHKYFFFGDEDYLKHAAIEAAKASVPGDPSFDFAYIGSADYSEESVISAIAAPPMFGAFRLVALSLNFSDLRPAEVTSLIDIISDVDDDGYTIVLLSLPSDGFDPGILPKKPSSLFKKLSEAAVPVVFDRVSGARLNGWVSKHFGIYNLLADARECAFCVSYCGSDMFRLASEIDKIACYVLSHGGDRVTVDDIKTAGCSVTEFDSFALSNAIVAGNHRLALDVLSYVKTQKQEPTMVMGEISRAICDMYAVDTCRRAGMSAEQISAATKIKPYPLSRYMTALESLSRERLKTALELARKADAGIKNGARDYVPIELLICSL